MLDLIIKNGKIIDGTGKAPIEADLGIKGKQITEIGNLKPGSARKTIDAKGNFVAPGFIDIQNHSDSYWTIFDYPHQESMLLQGITTILMGHCGASLAPLPSLEAVKAVQKWHTLEGKNLNWQYFDEYLNELDKRDLGTNTGSLIGHSTVRRGLMGDATRKITAAELKVLRRITSNSLEAGAFGLSVGLVYAHEFHTTLEELSLLAGEVKKFHGLLSVHLRSEGGQVLESMDEILRLAKEAEVRTKISHLKIRGHKNYHQFEQLLNKLEDAYHRGTKIYFDVYPYLTSWSVLYTYLPKWAFDGGRAELLKRLRQPYMRKKILDSLKEQSVDLSNVVVATATSSPHLVGRTLGDIAVDQGTSTHEALLNLITATESEIVVFDQNIASELMLELLKHPLSMIATDGAGLDVSAGQTSRNLVHPRCFGTMPRFLSLCLRKKLLPPEKMIYKITGMPAGLMGLADRGVLKAGASADVVVFDPDEIKDLATLLNPYQPPAGISWVLVNGQITVEEGRLTNTWAGKVLKA